jgi:hypothetical protein
MTPHQSAATPAQPQAKVTFCVQGVISPLLSNILLDDRDKELERGGHAFCRYADDCNIYVRAAACRRTADGLAHPLFGRASAAGSQPREKRRRPSVEPDLPGLHRDSTSPAPPAGAAKSVTRLRDKLRDVFRTAGRQTGIRFILGRAVRASRACLDWMTRIGRRPLLHGEGIIVVGEGEVCSS